MMERRIVITGMGALTPIGIGLGQFWTAMMEGKNGISDVTAFDTSAFPNRLGGEVKDFDPCRHLTQEQADRMGRGSQLAVSAAKMAVADAGLTGRLVPERTGVCMGTTNGESNVIERMNDKLDGLRYRDVDSKRLSESAIHLLATNVSLEFGIEGPTIMVPTACAAGNYAIGYACDLIKSGLIDVALAGGADALSRIAYSGFNKLLAVAPEMCQPFDRNRKGMIPAEGAAILVLETLESAIKRGAKVYAEVAGYGLGCDAYHITGPHPEGRGLIRAMENALAMGKIAPSEIDYVNAHGTGTPANDKAETAAIKKVFGVGAKHVPVSSIKSMIGHSMGAASAIEAVTCALTIKEGVVPPTMNYFEPDPECDLDYVPNQAREYEVKTALSNALAFGGNCAAIVLRRLN